MFRKNLAFLVLCAVACTFWACAGSKPATEPAAATCEAGKDGEACADAGVKLDSLRVKMAVTLVDENGKEQDMDAMLFSVPGKRYRMEFTGPLGIGVASLLWKEEGWTITFPTEKLYMEGRGYMVGLFGNPDIPTVNIHQMAGFFEGEFLPAGTQELARRDSAGLVLVDAKDPMGMRFTYATGEGRVLWISRRSPDGKPEVLKFLDYKEFEGRPLASRILFERAGAKYLEIRVKKVTHGKSFSRGTWRLKVPNTYKRVGG